MANSTFPRVIVQWGDESERVGEVIEIMPDDAILVQYMDPKPGEEAWYMFRQYGDLWYEDTMPTLAVHIQLENL